MIRPLNPVVGTYWLDKGVRRQCSAVTPAVVWKRVDGSIHTNDATPHDAFALVGDGWTDPNTNQLHWYTGVAWEATATGATERLTVGETPDGGIPDIRPFVENDKWRKPSESKEHRRIGAVWVEI